MHSSFISEELSRSLSYDLPQNTLWMSVVSVKALELHHWKLVDYAASTAVAGTKTARVLPFIMKKVGNVDF